MTARTAGALRVDGLLADPLRVPHGLDAVLRRMERGARAQRDRLVPLASRADAAESVRAAAEEVERFLEDEDRSPFLRALRRPLPQIAPDTPGGRSLVRCWDGLRARADAAVELQAALDGIRAAVTRVRDRFEGDLPRATRARLREARLDDAELARITRASEADALYDRLRRVEWALKQLDARVDADADARMLRGASWAEEAAPGELLALLELRRREPPHPLHDQARARTLRLLAARQVRALGTASRWARPARDSPHAVAQRMAESLLRGDADARGGEDLALWGELLCNASDTVHGGPEAKGWAAHLSDAPLPDEATTGSTRFVLPLDDTYAFISPHHPTAVRITDRRVELDGAVECTVFLEPGQVQTLARVPADVAPLFDGLTAEPGWYATARRAQLQVIAQVGDGWIARVLRRGTVRRTRGEAWDAERADGGRMRVLATLAAAPSPDALPVGTTDKAARVFCGVVTVPVAAPLAECGVAWLHAAAGSGWAAEAVAAQEACFRAVARAVPRTVPAWAGRGRLASGVEGPLYVPPAGFRAAEMPPLDAWLRGDGRPLLASTARLWLGIAEAGWALGAYHWDAFVFSVGWATGNGGPAPHAVVADAPFAAPLGSAYRPVPPDESLYPFYTGLGCRVLAPAVAAGAIASPATEAQAFALFALDAIAVRPLPLSGIVPADVLAVAVVENAASFASPKHATGIARMLLPDAPTAELIRWIGRLAG